MKMAGTGEVKTLVLAVDQGTSSTRVLIFDSSTAELLTYHQIEIEQIFPEEGWVEEDPYVILNSVTQCIDKAVENLRGLDINPDLIQAIGITNQRETLVVWDKLTGKPLCNAIIWLDSRTAETCEQLIDKTPARNKDFLRARCGLPISTYFTAVKMRWVLDNDKGVVQAIEEDRCLMGNVDSWLVWNLTGGTSGGVHVTDVTNASRTMLMNIHDLKWDKMLCKFFDIPEKILPTIHSSSEIYGDITTTCLKGIPIAGILGDQQAALVGQTCFKMGQAKNTYGTGCFLLYNTGPEVVVSKHGLLTTVAYKLGKDAPVCYALEGSVAIAGAAVRWLRDNLGIIKSSDEIESLASSVDSTAGCYFVPAFSGLFCPYWQPHARGVMCGLTQFTTKAHIARACLEATCFQAREVLEAMDRDSGISINSLQVDGGMTVNNLLMQLQADITGVNVVRPSMPETTALGAAMAAGAALSIWELEPGKGKSVAPATADVFTASITGLERDRRYEMWKEAVKRSMNWEKPTEGANLPRSDIYVSMPAGYFMLLSVATILLAEWIKYR